MSKKQKKIAPVKHVSHRQLSRKQKERKIQRIAITAGITFIVLVLALVGYGYYDSQYKPYHQIVLEVNDSKINMNYYLDMLRAYLSGAESSTASLLAESVLGAIENSLIIIQGAPNLGYTVEQSEIDSAIKESGLPNKQAYRDLFAAQTLQDKLMSNYFGKKVPESLEQVKVEAMVLETKEIALETIDKINEGMTFAEMAQAYGVEKVTKERGGDLGWLPKGLTARILGYTDATVLEQIAFNLESEEINQPVYDADITKGTGYWIIKVEERDEDISVHVRGILLGSLGEAQKVKQELEGGSDFASMASQISQDVNSKEDGGDLGWVQQSSDNNTIIAEAFELQAGEISEPIHDMAVETKGAYWVVRTLEKEQNRSLEKEVRDGLIEQEFRSWLVEQVSSSQIKELLTEEQKNWAVSKIMKELGGS